ncbi:MAG TPA: hypothetical protein VJJ83_05505 [Candidatus Babeliales bacterium]|nr:hypothetical protein [Candidatus Babeliales bacterium]
MAGIFEFLKKAFEVLKYALPFILELIKIIGGSPKQAIGNVAELKRAKREIK